MNQLTYEEYKNVIDTYSNLLKIKTIIYEDGFIYEGEVKGNKRHGYGKCYKDTVCFEGKYINDKLNGHGKIHTRHGLYKGNFVDGKLLNGSYKDICGYIYEGEFRKLKFHGHGKITYPDGSIREGEFINDKTHGVVKITDANGNVSDHLVESESICECIKIFLNKIYSFRNHITQSRSDCRNGIEK